jgi:DNA-formamidopyrimidine glycosylase
MPEGPEVKLTTEFLNKTLSNQIISKWIFVEGKYKHNNPDGFEEFDKELPVLVEEVNCKGKFIYFKCFNEHKRFYILHSLRLTGNWRLNETKYSKWYIETNTDKKIWFEDSTSLGTLSFITDEKVLEEYLSKLGPDILTDDFTLKYFDETLNNHKNKNITSFLMDQSIISGCGNYLKAEVLYYAKISPLRKVSSLTIRERELLYEGLRIVSRCSYMNRGLDLVFPNGNRGHHEFYLHIYGKKSANRTKTADGRITYWDEKIQV